MKILQHLTDFVLKMTKCTQFGNNFALRNIFSELGFLHEARMAFLPPVLKGLNRLQSSYKNSGYNLDKQTLV